jgi:pimeloyl-ACP methyl ester carboxylesterase/heme-degrading monooxygenase HmoA
MSETILFNIWRTDSRESQEALLAEMRAEAPTLAAKPGFLGLTIWASEDGARILVEGRWASRAHVDTALGDSARRERLKKFGTVETGFFATSFLLDVHDAEMAPRDGVTFIQVWQVGTAEHQDGWLTTMRRNVSALTGKPGYGSMRTHVSEDGQRVAVYARWRDRTSLEAAVSTPEAKAGHEAMRVHGTPEGAVYKVTDLFLPNPTEGLFEKASARWRALGFETSMISVNGVNLHVARAGSGSPLVLLHGYPQSGEIWRFVAPELANAHSVIIPDLPGMGLSGIVSEGYDLPTVADDMHELIARLGHEQVDVVGHDWGGALGAVWALHHRRDVRKFTFIESAVAGAGFESIWAFDRPNPAMTFIPFLLTDPLAECLIVGREEVFLHHLWKTFTHNKSRISFDAWEPYVDAMKRPGLIRSSASYYRALYGAVNRVRELIAAGKVTNPVLSISGQASFGEAQKRFVEAFANNIVRHVSLADAGHFVAEEQPEALLAQLRSFLDS